MSGLRRMDTEILEGLHSLHWSFINDNGLVVSLLTPAEVHHQLLGLADVQLEEVVPAL